MFLLTPHCHRPKRKEKIKRKEREIQIKKEREKNIICLGNIRVCVCCRRLVGKGVSMPTTAENRRPNPEECPPPGSHSVCTGDVAPWLPHSAGWQETGLLGHNQPACRAGGAAGLFPCPNLAWQAQPERGLAAPLVGCHPTGGFVPSPSSWGRSFPSHAGPAPPWGHWPEEEAPRGCPGWSGCSSSPAREGPQRMRAASWPQGLCDMFARHNRALILSTGSECKCTNIYQFINRLLTCEIFRLMFICFNPLPSNISDLKSGGEGKQPFRDKSFQQVHIKALV